MDDLTGTLMAQVFRHWPVPVGLRYLAEAAADPPGGATISAVSRLPLRLKYDARTYLGKFLYYRGAYEEGVLDKVKELLRPGMTFVDVGANVGLYAVVAGHLVGPGGRVLAIEPQQDVADLLRFNADLNRLDNIRIETLALGAEGGTAPLYQVSPTNPGQATLRVREGEPVVGAPVIVPVRTMDDVLDSQGIERVHGMKIDVEGAELSVLEGFRVGLEGANRPEFIYVECIDQQLARFGHSGALLIRFLRDRGYEMYALRFGSWRAFSGVQTRSAHVLALR